MWRREKRKSINKRGEDREIEKKILFDFTTCYNTILALGVPNAKYLASGVASGTLDIKKHLTLDVLNDKKFGMEEQYHSKFGMVRTPNAKK